MLDEAALRARQTAVVNAIANQRLAGLEVEAKTMLDLQRFARGECELDEVLNNIKARFASGEIFK